MFGIAFPFARSSAQNAGVPTPPRLVVVLVVDQMRADYLDRFAGLFTSGLRQMVEEGAVFTEARHDHAFTATAPGHATLASGVYPARSGIVANDWWDRRAARRVYAVEDTTEPVLDHPDLEGRSPRNLLRTTVADWLKAASPNSLVFSVAIKDRVAVLLGGHHPDGAYWYDYRTGRYVTSAYYEPSYPDWIGMFNDSGPVPGFLGKTWTKMAPDSAYVLSREDSFPAEHHGVRTTFPHPVDVGDTTVPVYEELARTPFGDMATLTLARRAVEELHLGADATPDLLFIGASSADLIGHRYGPRSQEVEDYYLRLDRMVGDLLAFFDDRIGRDGYVVVLSADHGVAMMPEEAVRHGYPGAERLNANAFRTELVSGFRAGLQDAQIFQPPRLSFQSVGLVFRFGDEAVTEAQRMTLRTDVAHSLLGAPAIVKTYTYDQLLRGETDDPDYGGLFLHSFHPDRAGDVVIRFRKHDIFPDVIPATHGSPYDYDRHVPLIFFGGGIPHRVITRQVRTVDVAPTVAGLLGVIPPDDLDGHALPEVGR